VSVLSGGKARVGYLCALPRVANESQSRRGVLCKLEMNENRLR